MSVFLNLTILFKAVIATYESRPMADDHKAEIPDAAHHHIC